MVHMSFKNMAFRLDIVLLFVAVGFLIAVQAFEDNGASAENTINCCFKGGYNTAGYAQDVAVTGDYAYVADNRNGLVIVDITDKSKPQRVGHYDTGDYAKDVTVVGDYAYVADSRNGLIIVDITNKSDPQRAGYYYTSGSARGVAVEGGYAYVAYGFNGLIIVDITNKSDPQRIGGYNTAGGVWGVAVAGNCAYVAADVNGLIIVDITNKSDPQKLGHYDTDGDTDSAATGVAVAGDYAYIADWLNGLVIVDITDKSKPQRVGHYDTAGEVVGIEVAGDYAYVADGYNSKMYYDGDGLIIVDITDKVDLQEAGHYDTTAGYAEGVAVAENYVYVADGANGLCIIETAPIAWFDEISPNPALNTDSIYFKGHGTDDGSITKYVWTSSIDGEFYNGTENELDYSALSVGTHTIYFKVQDNYGIWSEEISLTLHVLIPSSDDDGDGLSNHDELRIYHSDPLSSSLLEGKRCDISHSPESPVMIDELQINATVFTQESATSYYLHYKTLMADWKNVRIEDVETSGYINLNPWLSPEDLVEENLTYGRMVNLTYTFAPYEFTTGEEIQYYITDSDGFNYNDMEQKTNDDPANVNNIKTITVESETALIYSITDEALFSLSASILLGLLLLKFRFYRRFEKVKYAKEIGKVSQKSFIINMFQLFTKAKIRELLRSSKGGGFVRFIYFVGITGLLLIAGELFVNPKEISVLSAVALIFFLGISIITPFLFISFTRWKGRAPLIGRLRFIVASISLLVMILFFLAPRYYNEVLFEGTDFETSILAESEENTMYTYLAIFFLLFGVPTILYGNIMGTSWNFLVRTLSKEVRTGFSFLSWEREGISKRSISFFQLIAIAFMPLFAINALIGLAAGNYGKGGYIGVATAAAIGEIGYEDFTEIASRLVAIFILLNVVLVGAAMVFRVVQLQFLNSSRFSGKGGVVYKRHGDIASSKEDQLTLILMVFGIFFGYTILLLLLSIYSHFGYLLPVIPFVSVGVMETLMVGLSATTNFFFLLFWTVSLSRTRRVFRIERTPDGQGLIIPKTRRERKAEESFIKDFQMAAP